MLKKNQASMKKKALTNMYCMLIFIKKVNMEISNIADSKIAI